MSKNTKSKIRDIRKYNAKTEVKLVYSNEKISREKTGR